jgi:pimeloyl-ACP methyl ester carboxylesterase
VRDTQIVLLPGLDGTARLFNRFIATAPTRLPLTPIALPPETLTYDEMADRLRGSLPTGRLIIIAESYSGPLALAITARRAITGLILCNSFVAAPRARAWRRLAVPAVFNVPTPTFLLRRYLLGEGADEALIAELAAAVASVPPAVLASRLRSVLSLDASQTFARCNVPTLYLRGTDDRIVPDSAWRAMSSLRHVTMAFVPGPHLLLQANPLASWQAILPFFESLS